MAELSPRARSVLDAVVREFIATAQPVGSRTLSKRYPFELSAATIRNILSDLEELGYLVQPHTSAGRVPTEAGFRLFIDGLAKTEQLPRGDADRIAEWLQGLGPDEDVLRSTGRLLSELTGACAVVAKRRSSTSVLLKIHFVATRPGELLSVVVFSDGTVENRFIRLESPLSERQLDRLHGMLEEVVAGRTLAEVREHIAKVRDESRDELRRLSSLESSLLDAALLQGNQQSELIVEGQVRLLDNPELASGSQLRELMGAIEDREQLVTMLDRTLMASNVQVYLGGELNRSSPHTAISLVAAPFHVADGEAAGAVGVIGPTRMDYPVVVPLVGATAHAVSHALSRRAVSVGRDEGDEDA